MSPKRKDRSGVKTVLIGFMGSGKSTAARELGTALGLLPGPGSGVVDIDHTIESREHRTIDEIFTADGEAAFRALEERSTLQALADPAVSIISLGGGALDSEPVRAALRDPQIRTVLIDIELEEAWKRVSESKVARPLARDRARFASLFAARRPVYEAAADVILPTQAIGSLPLALKNCEGLPVKGGVMIWAHSASGEYPAYVREGLLVGEGLEPATNDGLVQRGFWPACAPGRRVLVSDHNVARAYGTAVNPTLTGVGLPPGERSKTLAECERVWTEMAEAGVTRTDVVVALGGGVVGDLAGFCAATYQRGMPVVQIPTTLVAQVDSAYGGKTGVDLPQAKNYVGAFHQPLAVLADPRTLASLPAAELAAGYAEVVKTALIAGGGLWELVSGGAGARDPRVIAGCALTKLRVVAQDELDFGVRQWLNLGHTVGHAIETVTNYRRFRHGEAVALGVLVTLRLSGADDLRDQVDELCEAAGLNMTLRGIDVDAVVKATELDKKRHGEGPVPFVLCSAPGVVRAGQIISAADLKAAVRELVN